MDNISRELPPDTTSADANVASGSGPSGRGPDELRAFERGQLAEHQMPANRLAQSAEGRAVTGVPPQ